MSDFIVGLTFPGIALLLAVAAIALWLTDRSKNYLLGFIVAPVALGASLAINHFSVYFEIWPPTIFAYCCSMTASIAFVWAVCTRLKIKPPVRSWFAIMAMMVIFWTLNASLGSTSEPSFIANFFLVNASCGIVFVMGALLLDQSGSRDVVDRLMKIVMIIVAAQFFFRPALVIVIEGEMTAAQYRETGSYSLLSLVAAVLSLAQAGLVLAAIMKDRFGHVREESQRDPLTGLLLRGAFEEKVSGVLAKSQGQCVPVSLIIGDIDHFKQVNDTFGHQAGDQTIASFGALIGRAVRDSDICGRVGGEEFCVLVWKCDIDGARNLAERLRRSFATTQHESLPRNIRVTASFGVAQLSEGEGYGKLFARADKALYEAKNVGRDRVIADRKNHMVEPVEAAMLTSADALKRVANI